MPISAVVIGGTGAVGQQVIAELLQSTQVIQVTSFGRRRLEQIVGRGDIDISRCEASGKLVQRVINMNDIKSAVIGERKLFDTAFCCIGTTRMDAGSAKNFRAVDFGYTKAFAEGCQATNVKHFLFISCAGATKDSFFLYPRTKGEAENVIKAQKFLISTNIRTGLLDRGQASRFIEKVGKSLFIPSVKVTDVAKAMCIHAGNVAASPPPEQPMVENLYTSDIYKMIGRPK